MSPIIRKIGLRSDRDCAHFPFLAYMLLLSGFRDRSGCGGAVKFLINISVSYPISNCRISFTLTCLEIVYFILYIIMLERVWNPI